ncbi:hypothetical protein [Ferruginibacter sp.]
MKKIIIIILVAVTGFTACKKDPSSTGTGNCTVAKIVYGGDPAADGVGWVLMTDTVNYKREYPDNLADEYKVDGLLVNVCFEKTDKDFVCFCGSPLPKMVHITSISKH